MTHVRSYGSLNRSDLGTLEQHTVAILPAGAMENHGPHLPLDTDTRIARAIVDGAVSRLASRADCGPVLLLPPLWVGLSTEHTDEPGTLSLTAEAFLGTIAAIGMGLKAQGIRRLVILNAHGGNTAALAIGSLDLRARHGLLVATPHWSDFGWPMDVDGEGRGLPDHHAGWVETSMMLAIDPGAVALASVITPSMPERGAAPHGAPAPGLFPDGPVPWGWMAGDLGADGVIGDPAAADAEVGHRLIGHAADGLAKLVADLGAAPWPPATGRRDRHG